MKKIFSLILILLMVLSLCACAAPDNSDATGNGETKYAEWVYNGRVG